MITTNLTTTGYFYQGEVENWKFTRKTARPRTRFAVPLGLGIIGLAGFGRKMKK